MQTSIQQFLEVGTENLQRQIRKDLQNGKDIGSLSISVVKELFVLGRNILSELIEDLDEELRNDSDRLKEWTIVNKQPNSLITRMGTANYDRTCFKNKKNGACSFLADELMGILPHERICFLQKDIPVERFTHEKIKVVDIKNYKDNSVRDWLNEQIEKGL